MNTQQIIMVSLVIMVQPTYLWVSQNHFDFQVFAFQKRSNTYIKGVNQESQHYNEVLNTDTQHSLGLLHTSLMTTRKLVIQESGN